MIAFNEMLELKKYLKSKYITPTEKKNETKLFIFTNIVNMFNICRWL